MGIDPLSLIGGGASLIGGLVSGIIGAGQKRKGRKMLREIGDGPQYEIPDEITNAAATGLPSEQYNQAMKNIQRQQMFALSKAQDRRGGLGALGGIQQTSNDAMGQLDAQNAQARQQNQRVLAGYRDKAFDWNKKRPYEQKYQYGMSLLGTGNQNVASGIDQGITGAGYIGLGLLGGKKKKDSLSADGMYGSNPDYDYFQPQ